MRSLVATSAVIIAFAIPGIPLSFAQSGPCEAPLRQLRNAGLLDACLATDVFFPQKRHENDQPPQEVAVSYQPIERSVAGAMRCQMKTSITSYTEASRIFDNFITMFPNSAAGHEISNPTINSISFSSPNQYGGYRASDLKGNVALKYIWKYKYPCIEDWELKWCDGWTQIYQVGAGWKASIVPSGLGYLTANPSDKDYAIVQLPNGRNSFVLSDNRSKVSPFSSSMEGFSIDVPRNSSNFELDVSNDLVNVLQAIVRVFGEYLRVLDAQFLGILDINHDQFRKFNIASYAEKKAEDIEYREEVHFGRNVLGEQVGNFNNAHTSQQGKKENIAITALLDSFAGDGVDFRASTHSGKGGRYVALHYGIKENRLLDRIYASPTEDPIAPLSFCTGTKKALVNELRQILHDTDRAVVSPSPLPWQKAEDEGLDLFYKSGLARTINSYREAMGIAENERISRIQVVQFMESKPVARNFSTYQELASHLGLNDREKSCVRAKILSISGDINLVYPGTDFSDCLIDAPVISDEGMQTLTVLDEQLATTGYWDNRAVSTDELGPPIQHAQYRGWYYCYRQSGLCGTNALNVIRWDPEQSQFGGRAAERNMGIDIFSVDHVDGASQLRAVASGQLHFARNAHWGNSLILPFVSGGRQFFAVYSNLGADAASLDQTPVAKGDSVGVTGCSGGTGGNAGVCNSYCKYADVYHTDESLHFELIERVGPLSFVPVNPLTVIKGWSPRRDPNSVGNTVCAECRGSDCIPSKVDGVH